MRAEHDRHQAMGEESITRLLLRFSLPATLAMAVNASYNFIDTVFVGRLGAEAIAALSISFPIQMLLGAIAIGTGVGAGSLISRSLGAGNKDVASSTTGQVILLCLAFGLVVTLGGLSYLRPLLVFFGATPEIIELSADYMSVIASGAVLLFLIMMMNHTVRAEGNAMLSMTVMVASALANIILDPIFIFALGMGIRGAAVATVLAKVVGVGILIWYFAGGRSSLDITWGRLRPNPGIIADIYRVGLPSLFIQVSSNVSLIVVNRILGDFGYIPIAVMGLVTRFQMFAFMPIIGISQGLIPIIGFNFGARKYLRIREAMLKGAAAGTVLSSLAGLLLFAFPSFLLQIFTKEPEVLAVGASAVRIMVLMYPLLGAQTVSIVFFQAIGKGIPSLLLSLLRQFLLFMPFVFILPGIFGLRGIWMATPLADLLAFVITIMVVSREFRLRGIPFVNSSPRMQKP